MSLVKEFAVEPRVMAKWEHFNSLWEDFGVEQGRLIAKYPLLWKHQVDELAKTLSKPVQATAISAKIRRDDHKFLTTGRTYNGNQSWLANARSHTGTRPFHAIIAIEKPLGDGDPLLAGEFPKDEPPYKVVREDFIPRLARELARCAGLLLENCGEIGFVDPLFDPSEPRWRKTFDAMLQLRTNHLLKRVEIHVRKPDPFIPGVQQAKYDHHIAPLVPAAMTANVFFWSQMVGGQNLHPRFLLTDIGGFHFENGLDEGKPGETTLVRPLSLEVWRELRARYYKPSSSFNITPDCIVPIRGKA